MQLTPDDYADLLGPPPTPAKRRGRPPTPADDPLKVARARAAEASAEWNELKTAKLAGELVEASAVGAISSALVAWQRGRLSRSLWNDVLQKTLGITCMFMWILIASLCFGAVFDGLGAVKSIERFFLGDLGLEPWQVLVLMQLSFLIMGMFLDDTAMLVIVAPLYSPLVQKLGFDLVWYGVLYTITCQIAYMTPPFGYNLFLMKAMAPKGVTLNDIYASIVPMVLIMLVGLVLVMLFPDIAMFLPRTFL